MAGPLASTSAAVTALRIPGSLLLPHLRLSLSRNFYIYRKSCCYCKAMLLRSKVVVPIATFLGRNSLYSPFFTRPQVPLRTLRFALHSSSAMQQKLTIPNKRGEKLTGVLHETGSDKIVVVCHGYTCTKDYNMMIDIATALENEGITAFRFDFSGNGESEGSFQFANYRSEIEDLRSVVEYFTGEKRSTVAVLGHSKGGDVVLLYASKYHDIPAVVNVSGRYDLKEGLEGMLGKDFKERFERDGYIDLKNRDGKVLCKVTQDRLTERLTTNMREACLSINKKCKVLTVHGTEDDDHPVKDAHEFAKCIPNHKLHIIEGANHEFSDHRAELITTILTFIKESLHADSSDASK